MNPDNDHKRFSNKRKTFILVLLGLALIASIIGILYNGSKLKPEEPTSVEADFQDKEFDNGIHIRTGLKQGEGLTTVIAHCTACHSAQVIIQNRMNEERWNATIRWMQETQNLWDLGENQEVIVNYLVKNYPVINKGRRGNLENIEWYELTE